MCVEVEDDIGRYGPNAQVTEGYLVTDPGSGSVGDCSWQTNLQNIQLSIMLLANEALVVSIPLLLVINLDLTECLTDLENPCCF
jgi:hypothetical protein